MRFAARVVTAVLAATFFSPVFAQTWCVDPVWGMIYELTRLKQVR